MDGEKPQFAETKTKGEPPAASPWTEAFLAGLITACRPLDDNQKAETIPAEKMSSKEVITKDGKKVETIPIGKMPPKEVTTKDGKSSERVHSPANPPMVKHTIDKDQIKDKDKTNRSKMQVEGKVDGDAAIDCEVVYDWLPHKTKPDQLILDQSETTYRNNSGTKKLGKDIHFTEANFIVGRNTKRVGRYPTHDINRDGYDCEIESYPTRNASGDYAVNISRVFVGPEGKPEKATVEKINGKNYEHIYSTQVHHYARQSPDGDPEGLKSIAYYADEDGGTSKKLMQVNYVDEKGQRSADGKPISTIVYDPSKPTETKVRTVEHVQYNGATVNKSITEHDYLGIGNTRTIEYNLADLQWKNDTLKGPDGKVIYAVDRNLADQSVTVNMNGMLAADSHGKKSSGTFVFKQDKDKQYAIDSIEIRDSNGLKELSINVTGLKFVYNSRSEITGVEGVSLSTKDGVVAAKRLQKLFDDSSLDAKANRKIIQNIMDMLNPQK